MNGKIKTKFAALFAVALMITVCVVPMVGNDYGEAETEYIPSSGYEFSSATVSGVVLDKNGTGISGAEVTVSGPSTGTTLLDSVTVYTNSTGAYTAQVQWPTAVVSGSSPVNLTVTLTDDEKLSDGETVNPAYGLFNQYSLSFTGVTDGYAVTGADFKAGYYVIPGQIYYENGVNSSGAGINGGEVKEGATLTLKNNGSSVDGASIVVDSATGAFNVYVPSSLSLSTGDKLTITGTGYESAELTSIPSSFVVKKTGTYLAVISVGTVVADDSLTITSSPATGNSAVTITTTSVTIDADDVKPIQINYTLSSDASATDYTVKLTSSAGYGDLTLTLDKAKINYSGISYNQTNYVSGTVSMAVGNNVVYAAAGGTVTLTFYKEQTCTTSVGTSITGVGVLEGGKYIIPYGSTYADAKYVKVTYSAKSPSTITSNNVVEFENGSACTANVSVDSTGYNLVYGKVLNERNIGIKGVTIGINDANAFGIVMPDTGSVYTVATNDNGSYAIFTKANIVTITPNDYTDSVKYDIGSVQKEINGNVSQNFIMKDKVVKITVTDTAANNEPMQGVTIKYAVGASGVAVKDKDYTVATVKTDADGVVELVFDGNALIGKTLHLKADYTGRTFGAATSTNDEFAISTNDVKYKVNFISNGKAADITGLTLPAIVEGTESVVPSSGTTKYTKYEVEEYGALTLVNAKKGEAFFYGPSPLNGFYLDFGSKTFGKYYVSEYMPLDDDSGVCNVSLAAYSATGYVKDATDNAIAGATVTLLNANDVVIGSGVTNSVGYYEFATTQATVSKVKITNAGVYTFNETYTTANITALEGIFTGVIQDAVSQPIYNADIVVTSKATVDGQTYTSNVDAFGKFKYIGIWNDSTDKVSTMLSAVDADSVYTFETDKSLKQIDLYGVTGTISYSANEATYKVTVPAKGLTVEIYNDSTTEGKTLVVGDLVSDKSGSVTVILEEKTTYKAIAKSVEYGYEFESYAGFSWNDQEKAYTANVTASNTYTDLVLKTKAGDLIKDAGYVVSSYELSGAEYVKVGEATAVDGKVKIIEGAKYTVSSPEGALYTFGTGADPYINVVVVAAADELRANESVYSGSVLDAMGQYYLEGVTVTLKNVKDKIVGTGVTDKDGNFKVVAIEAVKVFAADADLAIGKFTFDKNGVLFDNSIGATIDDQKYAASIFAKETLYSGYYADGAVVKDVKVSYTDSTGAEALATVVDNKYYIVSLKPVTGSVTATATNFYASGAVGGKLTYAEAEVQKCTVETGKGNFYAQIIGLGADGKVFYGTVLTLVAQNEYSIGVPEEDGVIQKYKFAGWYVNGDKVSDELIYAYTVEGDCTIYADYKVSSYVAAPADESNGLSMDVLVLGIVIVVLGLLAFAYAVKFKKE